MGLWRYEEDAVQHTMRPRDSPERVAPTSSLDTWTLSTTPTAAPGWRHSYFLLFRWSRPKLENNFLPRGWISSRFHWIRSFLLVYIYQPMNGLIELCCRLGEG